MLAIDSTTLSPFIDDDFYGNGANVDGYPSASPQTSDNMDPENHKLEAGLTLLIWILSFGASCGLLFSVVQFCRKIIVRNLRIYLQRNNNIPPPTIVDTRQHNGHPLTVPTAIYDPSIDPHTAQTIANPQTFI
ncbi:uncharacterized protein LOC142337412 isoform X1 [Convolutriloba macropyga]|uniref:uncharacterized protein LOC142337412 isoform X1 n=1 Tax=Convolutriloba macropyga TaxID=536237 RepID=UPI003F523DE2